MSNNNKMIERVKNDYLLTLQQAHEARGFDKDFILYEHIILLRHFIDQEDNKSIISLISEWITERRSLIEYFCTTELIDKCLEAIVIAFSGTDSDMEQYVVKIAKERLSLIKNGMNDNNIKG